METIHNSKVSAANHIEFLFEKLNEINGQIAIDNIAFSFELTES